MKILSEFKNYRGLRIVIDENLSGEKYAEMHEKDKTIRVPPTVYELLQSDFNATAASLKVRIIAEAHSLRRHKVP